VTAQQLRQLETLIGSWRTAADFQRQRSDGRPTGWEMASHELEGLVQQWKTDAREKRQRRRRVLGGE
jgi:hypothetical protein